MYHIAMMFFCGNFAKLPLLGSFPSASIWTESDLEHIGNKAINKEDKVIDLDNIIIYISSLLERLQIKENPKNGYLSVLGFYS